jgi:hypothetical protein
LESFEEREKVQGVKCRPAEKAPEERRMKKSEEKKKKRGKRGRGRIRGRLIRLRADKWLAKERA